MKYFQQTIFGDEVLMDTKGKVYKTTEYTIEYKLTCTTIRETYKATKLNGAIEYVRHRIGDFQRLGMIQEIKGVKIIETETGKTVKEYKQVKNMKIYE